MQILLSEQNILRQQLNKHTPTYHVINIHDNGNRIYILLTLKEAS